MSFPFVPEPEEETSSLAFPDVGEFDEVPSSASFDIVEAQEADPMDLLENELRHKKVLDYLNRRIEHGANEISRFHDRWESNERKLQAYIFSTEKEEELKQQNKEGKIPSATKIIVPFAYAAQSTIVTYLLHVFANRRPIFQVGAHKGEGMAAARNMETVLQYQADQTRLVSHLWKFFNDICAYGVGILRVQWEIVQRKRTRRSRLGEGLAAAVGPEVSTAVEETVYEGNRAQAIDPFTWIPDPRVSMSDVAADGEFCFWGWSMSRLHLRRDPNYRNVEKIGNKVPMARLPASMRNRLAQGTSLGAGSQYRTALGDKLEHDFVWVEQGTCWIVPSELELGKSKEPELWFFTIGNKDRIIEAFPFDADHGMHPVAVSEPYGFGYGLGQPGPTDFVGPIQDLLSWFFNSHVDNVRTSLNNMWVADPSRIVITDLMKPGPGKVIRLKKSALGTDVRTALYQLPVQDVTRSHVADAELMLNIGQMMLALNENIMGQQDAGGRKTASEVRISGQAAMSRQAMIARVISSQAITQLGQMMSLNTLQYLSDDFYLEITGADGQRDHIRAPDLDGSFVFPVHDGSIPLDKFAMLEVWKEIFLGLAQNEMLAQRYDVGRIFEHVAELGGATDIERFRVEPAQIPAQVDIQPDAQVDAQVQQGNLVPFEGAF